MEFLFGAKKFDFAIHFFDCVLINEYNKDMKSPNSFL